MFDHFEELLFEKIGKDVPQGVSEETPTKKF